MKYTLQALLKVIYLYMESPNFLRIFQVSGKFLSERSELTREMVRIPRLQRELPRNYGILFVWRSHSQFTYARIVIQLDTCRLIIFN